MNGSGLANHHLSEPPTFPFCRSNPANPANSHFLRLPLLPHRKYQPIRGSIVEPQQVKSRAKADFFVNRHCDLASHPIAQF